MTQSVKSLPAKRETGCSTRDLVLIPGSGRYPGEENDNPLQYSCLGNTMGRGACGLQSMGLQESDMT